MRSLIVSNRDSKEFISEVINSTHKRTEDVELRKKGKPTYKDRCNAIVAKYGGQIDIYDRKFASNSLEDIVELHPSMNSQEKSDYQALYKYDRAIIKTLRDEVLASDGYYNMTCPLCEVNTVQTMDHFIPQKKYPLYSISPKNLIPSCQSCNGHKSEVVLDGNKRKYWNVYLDKMPTEKFLYCKLQEENGLLKAVFYIRQNDIDDETFRKLKNTMEGQHILQTYSDGTGSVINKLRNDVLRIKRNSPMKQLDDIFSSLNAYFESVKDANSNNWKEVLQFELIKSDAFKNIVQNELNRLNIIV